MAVKFYNPGPRIFEKLAHDHPTNDVKMMNTISYYQLDAPEKAFFDVPTELTIETEVGEHTVPVRFADRIQADYKPFGVVRINPKPRQPIHEDDNVALTEKEAREKGERLWREAMMQLVREHKQRCDEARNANLTPQRAKGTVAHALRTLGLEDPANDVADLLQRKQDDSRVAQLEKDLAEMRAALLKGK